MRYLLPALAAVMGSTWSKQAEQAEDKAECKWTVHQIERISAEVLNSMTAPEFFAKYGDLPVVVTGLTAAAPLWTPDSVAEDCKYTKMPTFEFDKENDGAQWARLKAVGQMPMKDFAEYTKRDFTNGEQKVLYGFDYQVELCPNLARKMTPPPFAETCLLQEHCIPNRSPSSFGWPTMMMGVPGTRSELHSDNNGLAFWMAVHHGTKHWRVLPQGHNAHLTNQETTGDYMPPAEGKNFSSIVLEMYMTGHSYKFEGFEPDFEKFPRLCEAQVWDAMVTAGEVIWIPNTAAHGVVNQDVTIATTSNFFHPHDIRQRRWLEAICEGDTTLNFGNEFLDWGTSRCKLMREAVRLSDESERWKKPLGEAVPQTAPVPPTPYVPSAPNTHMENWFRDTTIPLPPIGSERLDLTDGTWYNQQSLRDADSLASVEPPRKFETKAERRQLLQGIQHLLRTGLQRAVKAAVELISKSDAKGHDVILASTRQLFDAAEDFYQQAQWTVNRGWHQMLPTDERSPLQSRDDEHIDSNFWSKFRPYLQCRHIKKLGDELAGRQSWCNPEYLMDVTTPRSVLIAGTGRDASYEDLLLDVLPDAAIIHADCLKGPRLHNQDKIRHVDRCLHGLDPGDTVHLEEDLRDKFVSLQDLKDGFLIESGGFNIIKANLGAFEYPAFGAALRDADRMLADTHQIHLEMHRFRSDTTTRAYSSLCLGELLFASFFSAGFFPVAAEQRLDLTEAKDVLWVNATWWLASELYMAREAWKRPRSAHSLSRTEPLTQNQLPTAEDKLNTNAAQHDSVGLDMSATFVSDCNFYWINNLDQTEEVSVDRLRFEDLLKAGDPTNSHTSIGHAFLFVPTDANQGRHLVVAKQGMSGKNIVIGVEQTRDALKQQPWLEGYLDTKITLGHDEL